MIQAKNKLFFRELGNSSSVFLRFIIILKICITLFAIYIYASFSPFLDAERYLSASLQNFKFSLILDRTLFTDFVYAFLKFIFISDLLVHLFISVLLGFILWHILKEDYKFCDKPLLFGCLLLPHFLIWSGVVGKEALAIAGFLLLIKGCVDLVVWNKTSYILMFGGFFLAFIERPHYALAYAYLLALSLIIAKSKIRLMSLYSQRTSFLLFLIVSSYILLGLYCFRSYYRESLLHGMIVIQQYFWRFVDSNANRWDVDWERASDFISNLFWGLPMSIVGPTWSEALARPLIYPVFLEGCFSLLLLVILLCASIRFVKKYPSYYTLMLWGFLPTVIIGILLNYPWGLFNPGSAIRYKQSLTPLLYFYPILLMAANKRKQFLEKN